MWGEKNDTLVKTLCTIYGDEDGKNCYELLCKLLLELQHKTSSTHVDKKCKKETLVNAKNYNTPCLIAYGDSLISQGMSSHATPKKVQQKRRDDSNKLDSATPLQHLRQYLSKNKINVGGELMSPGSIFQLLHILPFYPWDTDRGFSVRDYRKVDARNGNWNDVREFVDDGIGLMFDFVANHASVDNPLIQASLIQRHVKSNMKQYEEVQAYKDFAIAYDVDQRPSDEDILKLARPRPNPVLTAYYVLYDKDTDTCVAKLGEPKVDGLGGDNSIVLGKGFVWTTFSRGKNREDGKEETRQVDLNFANINVLMEVVKILLFYIDKGAVLVRLDAIGYIWKEIGSTSLHEEKAHLLLEVIRIVLEKLSPSTVVVAEVNEPNSKLIPYLGRGKGHEECDMVYQFASYALATHAVLRESSVWYRNLVKTSAQFRGCQYVTLLGSHDGMAMKQAGELLPSKELSWLGIKLSESPRNCLVNYASKPGGVKIVYECCGTPWSIINGSGELIDDDVELRFTKISRYLAVVGAGLSLRGMPAIYLNGLLCSTNFLPKEGLDENRTILRQRIDPQQLEALTKEGTYGEKGVKGIMYLFKRMKQTDAKMYFVSSGPDPIPIIAHQMKNGTSVENEKILCVRLDPTESERSSSTLILVINMSNEQQTAEILTEALFDDNCSNDSNNNSDSKIIAHDILNLHEEMFESKHSNGVSVSNTFACLNVILSGYGQMWVRVEKKDQKH